MTCYIEEINERIQLQTHHATQNFMGIAFKITDGDEENIFVATLSKIFTLILEKWAKNCFN